MHLVSTGGILVYSIVLWKTQSRGTCWMSTSQTPLSHFFWGPLYLQGDYSGCKTQRTVSVIFLCGVRSMRKSIHQNQKLLVSWNKKF